MTTIDPQSPLLDPRCLALRAPERQRLSFVTIGRHAALVIDDLYENPDDVRRLALALEYRQSRGRYPGYHATISLDPSYLAEIINRYTDVPYQLSPYSRELVFATVTDAVPRELRRQGPHIDPGCELAAVVYLNLPEQCRGGTAFYRHRETGLVAAPAAVGKRLAKVMREQGLSSKDELLRWILDPPPAAVGEEIHLGDSGDDRFERVELLEMKYNRLVVYPSALFHSALVEPGDFGETPETRRLTQLCFLEDGAARRRESRRQSREGAHKRGRAQAA